MTNVCISSPACDEDCCRCEKYYNETQFEVRDYHTGKLVEAFETEQEAKEYCNYVQKCKEDGEIINSVYYI